MMQKTLLFCLFALPLFAAGQISGVILDANTHRQVYGANIFIEGSQLGTTSNRSGAFDLTVPSKYAKARVTIQHISYYTRQISVDSLRTLDTIYLVPRVIPLQGVEIVGEGAAHTIDIKRDIPQSVKILDAGKFDILGFVDAGDFLNTEAAVQVQEDMSGKKTLSIRGGNADDVIVLYNGVRMNSPFDNVFDFSLVDLTNLERFEVIKGSNTSLYGPEAFSGVINIVPQVQRDYMLFTQYRTGTYNTEYLNVQANKRIGVANIAYSFTDASQLRRFIDSADDQDNLKNTRQHHNATLNIHVGDNQLNGMYSKVDLNYDNGRDGEGVSQLNEIASARFSGSIGTVSDINLFSAYKSFGERQTLNYLDLAVDRNIQDRSVQFDADKTFKGDVVDFLLGYNYQSSAVDFSDDRKRHATSLFYQATAIQRRHHGAVGIIKTHAQAGEEFFQNFNIDFSLRYDNIKDRVPEAEEVPPSEIAVTELKNQSWEEAHFKFAASLDGYRDDLAFKTFINLGSNTKFPTVVQRLSRPLQETAPDGELRPERVHSLEYGAQIFKEDRRSTVIDGWHAEAAYFRNYYTDKFRPLSTPGVPIVFYDNVPIADIFGTEASVNFYFLQKKIDLQLGLARYNISDKSAFPFKSEFKRTLDLKIEHLGFSLNVHWFYESEQEAWIRTFSGELAAVSLEPFSNFDVHLSKTIRWGKARFFVNLSGRNLLNSEEVDLQGLAIRDRRAYITLGAQY